MGRVRVNATKDGEGNIIISEGSFEMLLNFLDNQKFIGEQSEDFQKYNQEIIDNYNRECRKVLHQRYIIDLQDEGFYLRKRYEHQDQLTPWSGEDVGLVRELFKDTRIKYEPPTNLTPISENDILKGDGSKPLGKDENGWIVVEPDPQPWLIERTIFRDYYYLTISEDGVRNRPWKHDEVENVRKILNAN